MRPRAVLGEPIVDPANRAGPDLHDECKWFHRLSERELDSLLAMAASVRPHLLDDPNRLLTLTKDDFDLGAFRSTLEQIWTRLKDGLGVSLVRGLPLEKLDLLDAAAMYWGIGAHLGHAVSNNPEGDMLGHVTDLGKTQEDPHSRGYQTREAMDFHCDQSSTSGCYASASRGPELVEDRKLGRHLQRAPADRSRSKILSKPFYWTKHGEIVDGEEPYYLSPVWSVLDGKFCASFGPKHIVKGHLLPGAPVLTTQQRRAIELAEEIAEKLHYPMRLQRGDIQFLNNFVTVHTRSV